VQIRNCFEVPASLHEAWDFLLDIPSTIACFPGAELTETIDAENCRGRVTVKLGPLAMVFAGRLHVEAGNSSTRSGSVRATWTEAKGRGNANTLTRFVMVGFDAGTRVDLETDLVLAGQIAQYGRGTGMISGIASDLIGRFADNLRAKLRAKPLEHTEISGLSLASRALLGRSKRTPE
jgi:carbon monoxide dehydrogenase subunit G